VGTWASSRLSKGSGHTGIGTSCLSNSRSSDGIESGMTLTFSLLAFVFLQVVNFAADCAHKAVIAENHIAVHDIVSWTVQYFRDFGINIWIREHGGWVRTDLSQFHGGVALHR